MRTSDMIWITWTEYTNEVTDSYAVFVCITGRKQEYMTSCDLKNTNTNSFYHSSSHEEAAVKLIC